MSTILNALKKLEQEHKSYKKGDSLQSQQHVYMNRHVLAPASWRDRFGRFNIRWTWVAIALIGLVIGFVVAGPDPAPAPPAANSSSQNVARAEHPAQDSHTTVHPVPDNAPARDERALPKPPSRPDPIADKAPSTEPAPLETEIIENPPVKAARHQHKTTRTDPPPSSVRKPEPKTSPSAPPASTAQQSVTTDVPDPKPVAQKPNPRFAQAQHLTDGRLEVQAIAWSPVVEDCMAVINNQIIHQGDSVDGFSVVEIGEDKVLVKEGPQYYVVYFGSR